MARTIKSSVMAFVALLIGSMGAGSVIAGCYDGMSIHYSNWPPYHFADEQGNATGLDVEILQHALEAAGCKYEMQFIPWKRALNALQHGSLDIGIAASKSPERENYGWFSVPYRSEQMVMFMRREDEPRYSPKSLTDLAKTDYNVGLILGIWYGENLEEVFQNHPNFRRRVLQQLEHKSVFDRLLRGRVDIVVSDLFNGLYSAQKNDILSRIKVRPEVINDGDVHYIFSKKSVPFIDVMRINKAISAYRKTEAYWQLVYKYIPEEFRGMVRRD